MGDQWELDAEDQMGDTVCICGKVYEEGYFMIQCDICRDWLHGECVRVDELQAADIDKYHCPKCEPLCGPSIMQKETNWHRHDSHDPMATMKPLQAGTKLFVEELSKRFFSSSDDIVVKVSGKQLTLPYLNQSGFNQPILVHDKEGLSISLPGPRFSVASVCQTLGHDVVLDVIDVQRQQTCKMTLDQFSRSFNDSQDDRVLNCLSLELSDTALVDVITPPLVARKLCWVNNVWPSCQTLQHPKPQVQKYCIMSKKHSFTDFHIDFGGTSVWYHVFSGEKHFFLIRPTPGNLSLYERWMRLSTQSETFLGDMVDKCYKLVLKQGQTLFIPTGWIHAVYTPVSSLVFGGNFLHSLNIQLQLRIYELEGRLKDPPKYRFPSFETVHWLAAGKLKKDLADLNSDNTPCPENLLNGIRALVATLRLWTNELSKHDTIEQLDCNSILKDLNKEVKTAEKISLKVNPPKPERESNRRRKKKNVDEDFIDLSDPSSLYLYDWDQKLTPGTRRPIKKPIAVKSKPPEEKEGMCDVLGNADMEDTFTFSQNSRQTVSPLRLNLNTSKADSEEEPATKPLATESDERFDLTDRDSVRQLMVSKKADLSSALDDAMADFDDGEGSGLIIDEKPKKIPKKPLKIRLSVSSQSCESSEDLLGITASPSTREAIAGMLSISQLDRLPLKLAMKESLKKRPNNAKLPTREEKINKVHQDEDFIYPTLDQSDEEDTPIQKDEAWNPKIKMSNLGPKMERPIRDSAKNIAIEKGLSHAAHKRGSFVKMKVASIGKIHKKVRPSQPVPSPISGKDDFSKDRNRAKKVGNTAKQRLGKILGLKF